jgi:hypothetical protein
MAFLDRAYTRPTFVFGSCFRLSETERRPNMTTVIILNIVLCVGVIAGVIAPLIWAIVTQHHHETYVLATPRGARQVRSRRRRRRSGLFEPIVWPAR